MLVSVTVRANENVPEVVAVPEIVPEVVKPRPSGRCPWVMVQAYGGVPPVAVTCAE